MRTASRMPPDLLSLMLMPCPRSAHSATSPSVWQSSSTNIGTGELLVRQPVEDLVEGEGIVAERVDVRFDEGERRLCRFVVALDRRGLAEAARVPVPHLDLDHLGLVL